MTGCRDYRRINLFRSSAAACKVLIVLDCWLIFSKSLMWSSMQFVKSASILERRLVALSKAFSSRSDFCHRTITPIARAACPPPLMKNWMISGVSMLSPVRSFAILDAGKGVSHPEGVGRFDQITVYAIACPCTAV